MADSDTAPESDERRRHRVRLARLEADMAYFQARLEIIGEPDSANQMAQRKAFKVISALKYTDTWDTSSIF